MQPYDILARIALLVDVDQNYIFPVVEWLYPEAFLV